MNAEAAEKFIVAKLRMELPEDLYYHGLHHSLNVANAALQIAAQEGITDAGSLALLKTAALYHDSGFLHVYQNHEEEGCRIAKETLPDFDFTSDQITQICGMIMATKLPQNPVNHLEKILCDADLDYLGRDDYGPVARTLFLELKERNLITGEEAWNAMQVKFLGSHHYWTDSSRKNRDETKFMHLHHISIG